MIICAAVFMPLAMSDWDVAKAIVIVLIEIAAVAMLAGFWLPERIGSVAFRIVAAIVFLGYTAYVVSVYQEWMCGEAPLVGRKSQASPLMALLGTVVVGLPSLVYALKGRFTFREDAAVHREYIKLLLQPDWQHCERLLGRPVPEALRELYADKKLVASRGLKFSDDCTINEFFPLQEQVMVDVNDEAAFHPLIFASSVTGAPIYLVCGSEDYDCVYGSFHEEDAPRLLTESVDEFLSRLRDASALQQA